MRDEKKSDHRWIEEQRLKEMNKEESNKYLKSKEKTAWVYAFVCYLLIFIVGVCITGFFTYQQDQLIEKYTDRTIAMGELVCEQQGESFVAVFTQNDNIVIECSDTNILVEVNKNG